MVGLVIKVGQINLRVMELLDTANTGAYGDPIPTKVPLGVKKGKAILVAARASDPRQLIILTC
jgi:hydroxylamine reductase